jgi:hypothetical protein
VGQLLLVVVGVQEGLTGQGLMGQGLTSSDSGHDNTALSSPTTIMPHVYYLNIVYLVLVLVLVLEQVSFPNGSFYTNLPHPHHWTCIYRG